MALDVSKVAVSQWLNRVAEEGEESLRARPHTGRPAELTFMEKQQIPELLSHGAEAYGFRGEIWTCPRIRKVIEWEYGVSYHKSHIARLLKDLQWTPQLPLERASQRDERAITQWRSEVWIEMKKKARLEHRILVFVDELGLLLSHLSGYESRDVGSTDQSRIKCTQNRLFIFMCSGDVAAHLAKGG